MRSGGSGAQNLEAPLYPFDINKSRGKRYCLFFPPFLSIVQIKKQRR